MFKRISPGGLRATRLHGKVRDRHRTHVDPISSLPRADSTRVKQARELLAPLQDKHPLIHQLVTDSLAGPELEALFLVAAWFNAVVDRKLGPETFWARVERLDTQLADVTLDREPGEDREREEASDDDPGYEAGEEELAWTVQGRPKGEAKRWEDLYTWASRRLREEWEKRGAVRGPQDHIVRVDGRPTANARQCRGEPQRWCHPVTGVYVEGGHQLFYLDGDLEQVISPDVGFGPGRAGPGYGGGQIAWRKLQWKLRDAVEEAQRGRWLFHVREGIIDPWGRLHRAGPVSKVTAHQLPNHPLFRTHRYHLADVLELGPGQMIAIRGTGASYQFERVR